MKKFYSLAVAALCAVTATAGNFSEFLELNRNSNRELKNVKLEYAPALKTVESTKAKAESTAPATLVGKSYVTFYSDDEKYNTATVVSAAANDSIVLGGFATGLNVKAKYDATTGKITIPTGMVIGNDQNYGDITLWALDVANQKYSDGDIVGTVNGNSITFDKGVYCTVVYNGSDVCIIWMEDISSTLSNGTVSFTSGTNSIYAPIIVSKNADNQISIEGISNVLYGGYYSLPATFVKDDNTATINGTTPVDIYLTSTVTRPYFLKAVVSNAISSDDLAFNITTTDNSTVLTATTDAGYVYVSSSDAITGTKYGGYIFSNFKFNVDFNIYTAEVEVGSGDFDPNPTINNVKYTLFPETKTAQVDGAIAGVTEINIPAVLKIGNDDYKVTAIKGNAFYGNTAVTTLHLPASLDTLGTDAFRNANKLRTLYIEDLAAWCGVKFANGNANPIYNVYPTSTSQWGKVYFNGTEMTGELTIPAGVKSIGRSFYGMKKLTKVNLPEGLETIGDQAFANCINITNFVMPNSVKTCGSAFFSCSGLVNVTLSDNLEALGQSMFYGCSKINELTIPASVKSIASMTFSSCSGITKLTSLSSEPATCACIAALDMTPFDDFYEKCTLYVPAGTKAAYAEADGWKKFTNVEELGTSGVNDLVVEDENAPAVYYNLQGQKVNSENLTPGIYVVRKGNKASKVLVK